MFYYYNDLNGNYTARSFPLLLDSETEVSENEYNIYMESENKKHETE